MTDLVELYRSKRARVTARATGQIASLWLRLPNYDDPQPFAARAATISRGAQGAVAALTDAYLTLQVAQFAHRPPRPVGIDLTNILDSVRKGTPLEEVYARPFTTLRVALADGAAWADALDRAQARAEQAIRTDIGLAARETNRDVLTREPGVIGYRRVLSGSGCDLCESAADEIYQTDQLMPMHPSCLCEYEPIVAGEQNTEPGPPDVPADLPPVEVVDHGELGPLLWNADHEFHEI